jgi:hypothetical protein
MFAQLHTVAPDAAIHHHGDARFLGALRGGFVNDALLQPKVFNAELDATFHDGGDVFRRAKHIHYVRKFGQTFQVRERFLASHLINQWTHRNDAITKTLQAACNAKTGARLIRR